MHANNSTVHDALHKGVASTNSLSTRGKCFVSLRLITPDVFDYLFNTSSILSGLKGAPNSFTFPLISFLFILSHFIFCYSYGGLLFSLPDLQEALC